MHDILLIVLTTYRYDTVVLRTSGCATIAITSAPHFLILTNKTQQPFNSDFQPLETSVLLNVAMNLPIVGPSSR